MKKKGKEDEITFKIITIGDSGVGKTSIARRYIYNIFDQNTMSTIGISFCFKEIKLKNGKKVQLKLLDTAGQEKYNALSKTYYKNADGVLFVFDLHQLESFENIESWIKLFEENSNRKGIPRYLIGNKSDLERKVDQKLIDDFIAKYNYKFQECSALNNSNIDKIFQDISEIMYSKYLLMDKDQKNIKIQEYVEQNNKKSNCICVIRT